MEIIKWNEPKFDSDDEKSVIEVIRGNYVNEGPKTKELEDKIKNYLNVKHVIMTANCTASLFLAIKADALIKGLHDFEVIVPDMSMIATATAVGWAGGKVKLVDIRRDDFTIDPDKIEKNITNKTSAIIPVHILGRAADLKRLEEIAKKYGLTIVEDSAGAFGSKKDGKYLGAFGKVGCFSLQSNKIITCGQGGFVVTDDDKYYEIMRRIRDFGRFSSKEFFHQIEGYNLKFSDLAAALTLSQLKKIEERKMMLVKQRQIYENELKDVEEIKMPKINYSAGEVPLWVDVLVDKRKELVEFLKSNNIYVRECWPAIHKNPVYETLGSDSDYPISSEISNRCLWLPNGPGISEDKILKVCVKIKEFYNDKNN